MLKKIYRWVKSKSIFSVLWNYITLLMCGYKIYKEIKIEYGTDTHIMFCPFEGTGDAYIVGLNLRAYIKKFNIHRYVVLEPLSAGTKVLKLFGDIPVRTISIEQRNQFRAFVTFMGSTLDDVHLMHFNDWSTTSILGYVEGINGISFFDMFHSLWLDSKSKTHPRFSNCDCEIDKIFDQYGLIPGRTVLLAPCAGTIGEFPSYFWREIIGELVSNGYKVILNADGNAKTEWDDVPATLIPYPIVVPFLDRCGYFIGIRSGLCDIVSSSKCRKIIVYPEKKEWGGTTYFPYFSLRQMPFGNNIVEYEVKQSNLHRTANLILEQFGIISKYFSETKGAVSPVFEKDAVALALAASNEYAPYLAVTLQSVLDNSSPKTNYDIVVLSGGISRQNQTLLQNIKKGHSNVSLRFVEVMPFLEQYNLYSRDWYHPIIYARLMLPELMKEYQKVLYIDSDIISNVDIAELYGCDLHNYLIGAIRDVGQTAVYKSDESYIRSYIDDYLGLQNPFDYINSGVVLFNIPLFRGEFSIEFLFDYATSRHWEWQDQDIFMTLFSGRIYVMEQKWNYLCRWYHEDKYMVEITAPKEFYNEFMDAREAPNIAHFIVNSFRQENPQADWNEIFWDYAKRTPYYELILNRTLVFRLNEKP